MAQIEDVEDALITLPSLSKGTGDFVKLRQLLADFAFGKSDLLRKSVLVIGDSHRQHCESAAACSDVAKAFLLAIDTSQDDEEEGNDEDTELKIKKENLLLRNSPIRECTLPVISRVLRRRKKHNDAESVSKAGCENSALSSFDGLGSCLHSLEARLRVCGATASDRRTRRDNLLDRAIEVHIKTGANPFSSVRFVDASDSQLHWSSVWSSRAGLPTTSGYPRGSQPFVATLSPAAALRAMRVFLDLPSSERLAHYSATDRSSLTRVASMGWEGPIRSTKFREDISALLAPPGRSNESYGVARELLRYQVEHRYQIK